MEIYLVGGALRDRLLGLPVMERDYVVVGATPQMMLERGFKQVGKDFPVFLHPQTSEEYALARTLRNPVSGSRYPEPHADPDVTLKEDLARRDLTINAIAESEAGEIIDPFQGRRDLQAKCLRHVSPAFSEDPIRVLRVARFMAKYCDLGFQIAPETLSLMRQISAAGSLETVAPERVWQELEKSLLLPNPNPFIETLRQCGALASLFPELDCLWGVPQPPKWHPEIDTGLHTLMTLAMAARLSDDPLVRFAALTHDLGKGNTSAEILPSHHGHEGRGARIIRFLCERLRVPTHYRLLAERCATYHGHIHRLDDLRPGTVLKVLEGLDAFRQPENVARFLLVCEADYRGRGGFEARPYPQASRFNDLFHAATQIDKGELKRMKPGKAVGEAIRILRLEAIKAAM
ncbi:multifunctional CCA addition/repair protein [bacterium endosymbiont of Escarpia laminata]|nr:MAG: multifunctional CCA addition/repair protein [bacterium endosymbiont of Escarpia laminata]